MLQLYIASYIIRKDEESSEDVLLNETNFATKSMGILFKVQNVN